MKCRRNLEYLRLMLEEARGRDMHKLLLATALVCGLAGHARAYSLNDALSALGLAQPETQTIGQMIGYKSPDEVHAILGQQPLSREIKDSGMVEHYPDGMMVYYNATAYGFREAWMATYKP